MAFSTRLLISLLANAQFSLGAIAILTSPAQSGPNAGGTLVLALNEGPIITTQPVCEASAADCASLQPDVTLDGAHVLNVVAVFHPDSNPRLAGVAFGIDYAIGAGFDLGGWVSCGDFELADPSWPSPGSGTAVTWSTPQTNLLVTVYDFGVFAYSSYGTGLLTLQGHPVQGGGFADDSAPAQVDPIAAYGSFGFFTAGSAPCPAAPGACCNYDGGCRLTTLEGCEGPLETYFGGGTLCDPNPCPEPVVVCCYPDGSCEVVPLDVCMAAGGDHLEGYLGSCDPQPCRGACCLTDGSCQELNVVECLEVSGNYQGGVPCDPTPCPTPTHVATWGKVKNAYR